MESSLNSSQTEPRMSKTLFKKPLTRANASFEVSLNESSTPETQVDKTDMDLEFTSLPKKTGLFKKDKKPIQQFNVTVEESLTESEYDKTVANQKLLFKHKNQQDVDFFNVSECESKLTVTQLDSLIESNISNEKESVILHNKSNPFRRSKRVQKENLTIVNDEIQGTINEDENVSDDLNKSNNPTNATIDNSETSVSNLTNKKNLFKMKKKSRLSNVENLMEVTSTEDDGDKSFVTKPNIFKSNIFKKQSNCDQMMEISSSDELTLSQYPNESFTPQETQSSSFNRNSSGLSTKKLTLTNTPSSDHQEIENNEKSISFNTSNTETNKTKFSKSGETSSLSKTSSSKSRNSTASNNVSSAEKSDLNISTSGISRKKQNSLNISKAENQELNVNNDSKSNSMISKKSKRGSLRESTKRSKTENSLNMSIADNDGGTSKGSANSFTDIREKNKSLTTTETIERHLSIDKNLSKTTNKSLASEITFEQSSYNDENLNNWMSDQSDHSNHSDIEDPQIDIPPVPTEKESEKDNVEKSEKCQEASVPVSWEEKFNEIVQNAKKSNTVQLNNKLNLELKKDASKPKPNPTSSLKKTIHKPPKLRKPAPFASKNLYQFLIKRLKPKYGIDSIIEAEQLVLTICNTVKKVVRKKDIQKEVIQDLKKKMAKEGIIETTLDFYEFVIRFLPYDFRVKVVPCYQPVTNTVYPPKDTSNPFDKIL